MRWVMNLCCYMTPAVNYDSMKCAHSLCVCVDTYFSVDSYLGAPFFCWWTYREKYKEKMLKHSHTFFDIILG